MSSGPALIGRIQIMPHTLEQYFCGPGSIEGLVLGYGAADIQQIRRGLGALRRALSE